MQDEFVDWINSNYDFVMKRLDIAIGTFQHLLDRLRNGKEILNPRKAYALANIKFEYMETKKNLKDYQEQVLVTISEPNFKRLNEMLNTAIDIIDKIADADFDNAGNFAIIMNGMAKNSAIDIDMLNVNDNMI